MADAPDGSGRIRRPVSRPDLICTAKTLAGGVLPLAATLASPAVVAAWDTADRSRTFFHGHSFTAHPWPVRWRSPTGRCSPSRPRLRRADGGLLEGSPGALRGHPRVRDVRVRGIIAAVELALPGGYLAAVGSQLRSACLENGVLLRPLGSVLYAMPPFCTTDASLEQIAHAMRQAIETLG